jgi:hypothetical protein
MTEFSVVNNFNFLKLKLLIVRFEVLATVTEKSIVVWVETSRTSEEAGSFRGKYRLHLRGRKVSQARK